MFVWGMQEAARVTPSIIFMPHLQNWLRQGYEQLRTVLLGALEALTLSVLLLVTSDVPRGQLQPAAEIFLVSCNNNAHNTCNRKCT